MSNEAPVNLTVKERILLHLHPYSLSIGAGLDGDWPVETTQQGIAEAVSISVSHAPRTLTALKRDKLLQEDKNYVTGKNRKLKTYILTSQGIKRARKLMDKVAQIEIKVIHSENEKTITVSEAWAEIGTSNTLKALVDGECRIEGTGSTTPKKRELIGDIPDTDDFVDRKLELEIIQKWISEGTPIMVVTGNRGNGTSTLVGHYCKNQKDCDVFWHDLISSPTLKAIQGFSSLSFKSDIKGTLQGFSLMKHTLFVFDGYHNVKEEIASFFKELVNYIEACDNEDNKPLDIKFIVIMRHDTPFYNRFYNNSHIGRVVKELEVKELSLQAFHELFSKELSKEDVKQVHGLTKGKPALISAFNNGDTETMVKYGLSREETRLLMFIRDHGRIK